MLCAISGEQPEVPVASRKSGAIFEKRLIESYLATNGKDPITGEELASDDLVALRTDHIARPRPPTQTSIPALLATFQGEWDAIALETFELKKQLAQTRQQLSEALYSQEAALRIIAKLSKERDDARAALAKVNVGGGTSSTNAGAPVQASVEVYEMEIDVPNELPEHIIKDIDTTNKRLQSTRRKRSIPDGWITAADIESFSQHKPSWIKSKASYGVCTTLSEDRGNDDNVQSVIYGQENGKAVLLTSDGHSKELSVGACVTDSAFWEGKAVLAANDGSISIFEDKELVRSYKVHSGSATGLSLHPCGYLLASVGSDKSYALYDLSSEDNRPITRIFTDSELITCEFHPDGHIVALGGRDGQIKIFDIKSGQLAISFDADGPINSLSFSENGTWLASSSEDSNNVTIWDLRKSKDQARIKSIDFGSAVSQVKWDYSAQFLAIVGHGLLAIEYYQRSNRTWNQILKKCVKGRRCAWDPKGQHLLIDTSKSILEFRRS